MHVALIVPAWNVAPWISDAMASVLAQTHADWSLWVIDDGSTDHTAEVAARFSDPRVTLLRQANAGVAMARNRGLAQAAGDAVLFLDADDWLAPDALSRLVGTLLGSPHAVAAYARFRAVAAESLPGSGLIGPPLLPGSGQNRSATLPGSGLCCYVSRAPGTRDLLPRLLERNLFANGGHVLIRLDAAKRVGGFLPGLRYGEDWEFWTRLALLGRFAPVPGRAPVLFMRERPSGAYLRMATEPDAFTPCMDAIFGNPALAACFGAGRLAAQRRRTEAENRWVIGRELVRHGRVPEGRAWLRRSVWRKPGLKRYALLLAAHGLGLLPRRLRGPFRPYG